MVRVPRAVFQKYHPLPFVELEAAAERGVDGLSVESPAHSPWPWHLQPPAASRPELVAEYERDKDHAYFRGGYRGTFDDGPSWLYQQNW